MSEDKKSLIDLVPDSVDNVVKNITDKPTQNMGTTLADIWYLVFGGISQAAEKRKLKYSYALQEFEKELKEKISKIPEDKLIEPDIHVVAQALEASKYCVEKEELRHMYAKLISNSLNSDFEEKAHPIYVKIINNMTPYDAKTLYNLSQKEIEDTLNFGNIIFSLSILMQLGLIFFDPTPSDEKDSDFLEILDNNKLAFDFNVSLNKFKNIHFIDSTPKLMQQELQKLKKDFKKFILENVTITKLGFDFISMCID